VKYEEWERGVPESVKCDPLWRMSAYRLSLLLADLAWTDVAKLTEDRRARGIADQLYRAVGSIGANLAEGYGRSTGKERAHFYEYALGSARESRHWYYQARHVLDADAAQYRAELLDQIIRLLVTMVPQQRESGSIREDMPVYEVLRGQESQP
jgi:four helix bundle protein